MEEKREDQDNIKISKLVENYWDSIEEDSNDYQNKDGKLMSHLTVEVDEDGQPLYMMAQKFAYVDE